MAVRAPCRFGTRRRRHDGHALRFRALPASATVWSCGDYLSRDLDFVIGFRTKDANPDEALKKLGYSLAGDLYTHAASPFTLDFPAGPLSVGRDLVDAWCRSEGMSEKYRELARAVEDGRL